MKLRALILFSFLTTFSIPSLAQFFPANVGVVVLPGTVKAQVFNPYYEPIVCSGQVFGQTIQGPVFNAFFDQQLMPAGTYRFTLVRTTPMNPFTRGWADINCRFARFW